MTKIAMAIATMHSGDSVHGDLTTSNMMIKPKLSITQQMGQESVKMTAQDIAKSGDLGDLVSASHDEITLWYKHPILNSDCVSM